MDNKTYPSDLTDQRWQLLEPLLPPAESGARPRTTDIRKVVNGIVYLVRSGCCWRLLAHDFRPLSTVYDYCRRFRGDGTWQKIQDSLHERVRLRRAAYASARWGTGLCNPLTDTGLK